MKPDKYKEPTKAEIALEMEHCLGKTKTTIAAGLRAMRDRIAYLENEIAAAEMSSTTSVDERTLNHYTDHITRLRADLREANIRLTEYEVQNEQKN